MGEKSKIEWCHHTFNPWIGCTKVGPGCDNCYAESQDNHRKWTPDGWGVGKPRKRTSEDNWKLPLRWNRKAEKEGVRYRVFCASLADVFDNEVPVIWRDELISLIEDTPNLDWLLLTKRIGNVEKMLPPHWRNSLPRHVWLGITVVNQEEADRDIPKLLQIPACVRWLSVEPMLSAISLTKTDYSDGLIFDSWWPVDWVVCGGESGQNARPMNPEWARGLRDQCVAAGVPFLFKQWGEFAPEESIEIDNSPFSRTFKNNAQLHVFEGGNRVYRVGKSRAGRTLDGKTWDEYPEEYLCK